MVEVVGRGDVDDVDPLIVEHRLKALVGGRKPELARSRRRSVVRGADDAVDLDAKPAQSLHVDDPDEAGAGDRGPDPAESPHSTSFAGSSPGALRAGRVAR